jgi:hypothetical protein
MECLRERGLVPGTTSWWLPAFGTPLRDGITEALRRWWENGERNADCLVSAIKGALIRDSSTRGARKDLWGWIDMLAIDKVNKRLYAIQATTAGSMGARKKKIMEECSTSLNEVALISVPQIWGWRKLAVPRNRRSWWPRIFEWNPVTQEWFVKEE